MGSPNGKQNDRPIPVSSRPLNAETPLSALTTPLTPSRSFYVRTHFDVPRIQADEWSLTLDGAVERSLRLDLSDLQRSSGHSVCVTLECAGNGRRAMDPPPPGLSWGFGAVGTARFTGVPLSELLDRAGAEPDACEVVFVGADRGRVESGELVPYARSLPLEVARHEDTVVAWAMNGLPLRAEHGFPARLVVPRWYAMASVKWLMGIQVLDAPFEGFFQKDEYVYVDDEEGSSARPVTLMRVRAVIGTPGDGAEVQPGAVEIAGSAWSGYSTVTRVEVTLDGGVSWNEAELGPALSPYAARPWRYQARLKSGSYSALVRATDQSGNTQPTAAPWNARGYGNNVLHGIRFTVTSRPSQQDEVRVIRQGSRPVPA
jgi:DMSO/TMAO reductase YedYZ molybdopterin-dependent catalytic subunit